MSKKQKDSRKPFIQKKGENDKAKTITRYVAHPEWNDSLEWKKRDKARFYGNFFHHILEVTGCYDGETVEKGNYRAACDLCKYRLRNEHDIENTTVKLKKCKFKGNKVLYFEFTEKMEFHPYTLNQSNVK